MLLRRSLSLAASLAPRRALSAAPAAAKPANPLGTPKTMKEELKFITGAFPQIDVAAAADGTLFAQLLQASPLAALDTAGTVLMGKVVARPLPHQVFIGRSRGVGYLVFTLLKKVLVDVGLKFPAAVRVAETREIKLGATLHVVVTDVERTMHLLGDSKHTTTMVALAHEVTVAAPPSQQQRGSFKAKKVVEHGPL